jgi:serine/threonine protein kinase
MLGARAYPEPGDTFGRYRIVRELGRGGYGSVLEARQLDLDRAVALKVLSPVLADERQFRERFAREAAMLAHLDSPHVIQVYEHGEHDGHLFIATQLVNGGDLKQLLRDANGVSPATALDLAAQVASGLADAHDAGLIHRDIKPSNILVRRYDDGWFAYLCDFGIAGAPRHQRQGRGVRVPAQRLPDQILAVVRRNGPDCLLLRSEPGAVRSTWRLGGAPGGLQWISYDRAPRETRRWQWSATYFSRHPYSVSVEATSPSGRDEGISEVEAQPPDLIGLD